MLACSQYGMLSGVSPNGCAPRARNALIACCVTGITKVGAPGALQYVAAQRRHIADLLARGQTQRLRDHGVVAQDFRMLGSFCHSHQRSHPEPLGTAIDARQLWRKAVDVDHSCGAHDIQLHQVDEGRAARQELGASGA